MKMHSALLIGLSVLAVSAFGMAPASAGPASDLAAAHIAAVAAVDASKITAPYEATSTLYWVGGPLNGTYTGATIAETWAKFGKAVGPLKATVTDMKESGNPAGSTVTANVVFNGKTEIKVRYIMLFKADKLVGEIWQIDPKLGA